MFLIFHICMCRYICMYAYICEDQRSTSGVFLCSFLPQFLRQSPIEPGAWLADKLQGSPFFVFIAIDSKSILPQLTLLCRYCESNTGPHGCVETTFTDRDIFLAPDSLYFYHNTPLRVFVGHVKNDVIYFPSTLMILFTYKMIKLYV